MTADEKVIAFHKLGQFLNNMSDDEFQTLALNVKNENPWFTEQNVRLALNGILDFLNEDKLRDWISRYTLPKKNKTIALVMAGNIPAVGFHDLLSVLISGHRAQLKLSSKDIILIQYIINQLFKIEPRFQDQIAITDRLKNFDAVIATGSDNTSRYFEYYFGKYPHIIRKNRTSVAVLDGHETVEELTALGRDVFNYFGLGCRNVSKLFVPADYTFDKLFESWSSYEPVIHHHKYCNNYDYQKSIQLVNRIPFLDNGFVMFQENKNLVSPISVIYYEYYNDEDALRSRLSDLSEKIQVRIGKKPWGTVPFGKGQFPRLSDYADNVDTMDFLSTV
ncbi:MAG TPA: acyl-CoA reductase [Ohtaekwangia sp.]|nr:acyl-CoA reductase [Ohtaekwangia sp.]